ncbi:RabGAP/TBC [Basidiobolus meristosporus CBS 931.73]|uniref:RabGAP/TBC n=1 Tax=Basidiobolus meristosporus CBS 931.73 TaxID=1314790 RepID=A0A1Y1Y4K7_9FUNG|nr:RabGAP/TBC [Basidiobolus meristosporus CBS 931.73]|eukprot:ORX92918.1 RabGAP/TBC [Basidiobolus meristosporus CBS 931.73]
MLGSEEDPFTTDTESVESEKAPMTPCFIEHDSLFKSNWATDNNANCTDDGDFWVSIVENYSYNASKVLHQYVVQAQQGIPQRLRGVLWQTMCHGRSTYLETMYNQLLHEPSPYERIIIRDLPRTFPKLDMFKDQGGVGQTRLFNVMKAYAIYDDGVGYCQGMGFLVGPLLMNMPEREAFCVFVRLMEDYGMRSMFTREDGRLRVKALSVELSTLVNSSGPLSTFSRARDKYRDVRFSMVSDFVRLQLPITIGVAYFRYCLR